MKKVQAKTHLDRNPVSTDNINAGYSLGQTWHNTMTGEEFYHQSDGVWISRAEVIRGNFRYDSQTPEVDTAGDWRTYSDGAGFYTQFCTLGNATKGAGTWVAKQTIAI